MSAWAAAEELVPQNIQGEHPDNTLKKTDNKHFTYLKSPFSRQETRVKLEKGGSLRLGREDAARLRHDLDQEPDQQQGGQGGGRSVARRDSIISRFFRSRKIQKEVRSFSDQFPPDPPAPSSPPLDPSEHIYSDPAPCPAPPPGRTSLSQLHLARSLPSPGRAAKTVQFSPSPPAPPRQLPRPLQRGPPPPRLRSPPARRSLKYSSLSSASSPSSSPSSGQCGASV